MKKQQQMTIRVKGSGNSKQNAFAIALSQVQQEVTKKINNILLRIEPVDIQVICASESITTERFLFFFLPRKKLDYRITLDVVVDVTFVDINTIAFKSEQ